MGRRDCRVLFKVSGSFEIGFGHIQRSRSLAEELGKELGRKNIFFVCTAPEGPIKQILDPYENFLNPQNVKEILNTVVEKGITVLVLDEPSGNRELTELIKRTVPKMRIAALDYFQYDNTNVDDIINLYNQNLKTLNPQREFRGQYYEGIDYAIIREDFVRCRGRTKKIRKKVQDILITFGGADKKQHSLKALDYLKAAGFTGQVDVLKGLFFKKAGKFQGRKAEFFCHWYDHVKDIQEFFFNADLAFTGAGTTLMEACSLGVPVVIMPQTEREMRFARVFQSKGAAKLLLREKSDKTIIKGIINDCAVREEMSRKARRLVDGKGKERIAKIILRRT